MRPAAIALMTAALLGGLASIALAQGEPNRLIDQPPTAKVPSPSSGAPDSSSGLTRPGNSISGNSASRPEPPSGRNVSPSGVTTEGPSLETRQVGPDQRPDRQSGNR